MTDHQLQPFESVELGEKQDQLQVFEKAVLEHEGKGSAEDSGTAPLPENYPYRKRMRRAVYEAEKAKLQIELLKVQSWVKDSGQRIVSLFEGRDAAGKGRYHQTLYGTFKSAWRARGCFGETNHYRTRTMVFPTLCSKSADCRRNGVLRPLMVQPRRRRTRDGLLRTQRIYALYAPNPRIGAYARCQRHPSV